MRSEETHFVYTSPLNLVYSVKGKSQLAELPVLIGENAYRNVGKVRRKTWYSWINVRGYGNMDIGHDILGLVRRVQN
jgi:hypothetical protein